MALLMGILLPALNRAREQGKRIVCMNSLRQLTLAWMTYAEANNDKIVNGAPQLQESHVRIVPVDLCIGQGLSAADIPI